jgi:hypothetical protein
VDESGLSEKYVAGSPAEVDVEFRDDLEYCGGTRYALSVSPEADLAPSRGFEHHGGGVMGV